MSLTAEKIREGFKKYHEGENLLYNIWEKLDAIFQVDKCNHYSRLAVDIARMQITEAENAIIFHPYYDSDHEQSSICRVLIELDDFVKMSDEEILKTFRDQIRKYNEEQESIRKKNHEDEEKRKLAELLNKYGGSLAIRAGTD